MIDDLAVILSEGESYTVEFKECADKSLSSEVCAFANASGGRVFIGVDDSGRVVGTDVSNIARSRIQDTISRIEPHLKVGIEVVGSIVVVTVPEGGRKPYSCPKGFYLRSGPNSQKLERDSIVEFFQSEGRVRYDEITREDLPISEYFNEAAYTRYIKVSKISDVLERDDILRGLGCARGFGGGLCFTNAGALFFRVNDKDILFRHAGIVCALYKGVDKAYVLDAKELGGDLISNIDDAMVFLKKHLRLSYKIEGLRRENILELPEEALREAVVNAVCHRDYFEKGSRVMVEIYDDRVDIVNPGGVCRGVTRENFGTISITRNAIIASMLYRFGYIEQMGTGVMRMKNAALDARVPEPEFEFSGLFFKATFRRSATASPPIGDLPAPIGGKASIEFGENEDFGEKFGEKGGEGHSEFGENEDFGEKFGEKGDGGRPEFGENEDFGENPTQQKIIAIMRLAPTKSAKAIAEETGMTTRGIEKNIRELKKMGLVERIGSAKGGHWVVCSR